MFYILPLGLSFVLAILLTPLIKHFAIKSGVVDQPWLPRKIHNKPIALLGGTAIFLSFAISVIVFWIYGYVTDPKITDAMIGGLLLSGLVLIIGGFLDDKYNFKPWQQLVFPILAIAIILSSGIKIHYVTNPFGGVLEFSAVLGISLAIFWLLGMIYTTKLLDGLDGLASGIAAIGSLIIFIVSLAWDVPSSGTSILALIFLGSLLGFLVFNWHPAKIFLGEGGSVFVGFILGVLAIISGSKIVTALLIMGIPILDVFWVILRRIFQRKSVASGDRKHLHYRLLDIGFSHRQTVLFLYFLTTTFGVASLFLHTRGKLIALGVLTMVMIFLAITLVALYNKKINVQK